MVNSGLPSLKRIRSVSTSKANGGHSSTEPAKLSKLKSGLRIWSKLTRPFTSNHHELQTNNDEQPSSQQLHPNKWRRRLSRHFESRRLNYSRWDTRQESLPGQESMYEPGQLLHKASLSYTRLNLRRNSEMNATINAHTVPATPPPAIEINNSASINTSSGSSGPALSGHHHLRIPTSILVKRNDSTISTRALGVPVRPKSSSVSSGSHHGTHHHHRFSSSNITVNSENLTAKEFADIAGIRILDECDPRASNNDSYYFDEDAVLHNTISTVRSSLQQQSHARSMPSASSLRAQPHIWDAEFWQNPDAENSNRKQQQQQTPRLRRLRTKSTEKSFNRSSCVIKKGRFEICLETAASVDAFMAACNQPQHLPLHEQQQALCGRVPKIFASSVDA